MPSLSGMRLNSVTCFQKGCNMKIKLGRYYRNRNGTPVYVYSRGGSDYLYPILGAVVDSDKAVRRTFTESGSYLIGSESREDLVEEWGDAPRTRLSAKTIRMLRRPVPEVKHEYTCSNEV